MIRAQGLTFSYSGREVFHGLDLHLRRGEILSILGPNGSGKSTLLGLLRGVLKPQAGSVLLQGRALSRWSQREIARRIAVVSQDQEAPFPFSVAEVVAMGRFPHQGLAPGKAPAPHPAVAKALDWTGLSPLAGRPVTRLSAGERQKVIIARALAQETPILFLDEAGAHLDLFQQVELARLLIRLREEEGKTMIHVCHDPNLSAEISDRVLLLPPGGGPCHIGNPTTVLTEKNLHQTFGLRMKVAPRVGDGLPRIEVSFSAPDSGRQREI
ncbi:MAG: ABC transporter ATP-binding protein [Deltaproteobacteria bacterium]|nr:ABC transporter ATP-binding protein [Deltaproteobacteria bacterium]